MRVRAMAIDQNYTIGQAVRAFARPEDQAAEVEFLEQWSRRAAETKGAAEVDALLNEFGGVIPRPAPLAKDFSSRNPVTRGLLQALRERVAVIHGRQGGLQYPKTEIDARVWTTGEFQLFCGGLVKGGAPPVEIHDLTILLAHISQQVTSAATGKAFAAKPLLRADRETLKEFLKTFGQHNERDAKKALEQRLGKEILRGDLRDVRREISGTVFGKAGRPAERTKKPRRLNHLGAVSPLNSKLSTG